MKRLVKIVSLFCIIAIVLSTTTTLSFAKYFSDVTSSTNVEIREAINYVSDHGIMSGTTSTTFGLNTIITRAQAVFILYKYSRDTGTYSNSFTDVSSTAYYYNAIGWAQSKGITNGTSATTFSPNANVTNESFILMLYKYAVAYGHPTSYTADLLYYTDNGSISSWAINAVKWALAYGVLPFNSSQTFGPQSGMARKNCALGIHRYTRKLDRGVLGRDNYGFSNSSTYFTHSKYYVNTTNQNRVSNYIQSRYSGNTNNINYYTELFNDYLNESWGGSCYGMSTSAMLDKLGILGVESNFSSYNFIGNITTLNNSLESMINVYQFSQSLSDFTCTSINMSSCSESAIQSALSGVNKDMFTLGISFYEGGNIYGHSLLITNWWKNSDGYYVFSGLDPNYPNNQCRIIFSNNHKSAEYGYMSNGTFHKIYDVVKLRFRAGDYITKYRNLFDYDGILNDNLTSPLIINESANTSRYDDVELQTLNRIEFNFDSDYTLTNAEGKYISFINGTISGDMKIYSEGYVEDLNRCIIYVEDSESYTLEKNSDELYLGVSGNGYQIVYNGSGNKATFYKGQKVKICNCDNEDFTLKYLEKDHAIVITGKSVSEVFSDIKDGHLEISGLDGSCNVVKREIISGKTLLNKEIKTDEKVKLF